MKITSFDEILREQQEDLFWQEVELRFSQFGQICKRPPKQIKKKLLGDDPKPGERAALAMFWGGLTWYRSALRDSEEEENTAQTGYWLYEFEKACKAKERLGDKEKTTSHNLSLFAKAWNDLIDMSYLNIEEKLLDRLSQEQFSAYWIACYFMAMAVTHIKLARDYYEQGVWSVGFQTEFKAMDTPARGIEYDRLLFRSASVAYETPVDHLELLPNVADGWLLIGHDQPGLLALGHALEEKNDHIEGFRWTDKAFQLNLDNGCRIVVEAAKESRLDCVSHGAALVFTPSGLFFEQFILEAADYLPPENINITFPGNSWTCQPTPIPEGEERQLEKKKRQYLRRRILGAIEEAHKQPGLQETLNLQPQLVRTRKKDQAKKSKVLIPKGNLLYGDL